MARSIIIRRTFGSRDCSFQLRWGEIEELEQVRGAGIGEIWQRAASLRFHAADIAETIRLALQGAGITPPLAAAIVEREVKTRPVFDHAQLAMDILAAALEGAEPEKREPAEGDASASPETSPPSTPPAP